jgi:CBS domain-containing protein
MCEFEKPLLYCPWQLAAKVVTLKERTVVQNLAPYLIRILGKLGWSTRQVGIPPQSPNNIILFLTRSLMMLYVKDIMTEAVLTIPASVTVAQAIALMQRQKVRSLIVICPDGPEEYGIITERDIVYKILSAETDPNTVLVSEIMRHPCISVHPEMSIPQVAQLFADTAIQRAPVIEDGTLLGVISVTDLLMKIQVGDQKPVDTLSLRIQEALNHARIVCDQEEQTSRDCAVAWDIVEELQAEASRRRSL